jgi:hypothetical protein
MFIATFDMGTRNFAFCVERRDSTKRKKGIKPTFDAEGNPTDEYREQLEQVYQDGRLIECQRIDLVEYGKQQQIGNIYLTLTRVLDMFTPLWDVVDVILIEQQMAYGRNKANIQALRLAQHCLSYFYTVYGSFKTIQEWSSTHKTRMLGCPHSGRRTHRERKQFSVNLATRILRERKDPLLDVFYSLSKQDDVSDCVLMAQTFAVKQLS